MLGLGDEERVRALAEDITSSTRTDDSEEHARRAVETLQQRVDVWQSATFADLQRPPNPAWLRAFLAAHPQALLADAQHARALADTFGDPSSGAPPLTTPFKEQALGRPRLPSWLRGLLLPALLTALATAVVGGKVLSSASSPLEALWVVIFAALFAHAALGCCTALRGLRPLRDAELTRRASATEVEWTTLPRTAVIIPIYHESATDVFAGIAAMRESLLALPALPDIEFFVLSDSQDPLIAAEEERALRRITAQPKPAVPVFYRRRSQNVGQKSGNLAEFFQRFGSRYGYVIVLDADSLMQGRTMVELIARIHGAPRVALLQAPIVPVRGQTLLARALQWSSSIAGPLFMRGLVRWSGAHGNYYGHNAILRTQAFVDCCALPKLRGRPPLGGPLLSHDFVEAALLCRGGWQVRLAPDLGGSYEELPPTLAQYVARDRRWCQGNLQHLRVMGAPGLPAMSRLHLFLGAAAYLAGPAWVGFTLLGVVLTLEGRLQADHMTTGLALALCLLVGPRLLGTLAALGSKSMRLAHGGAVRLLLTLGAELTLSALLGPILMLHHTRMVAAIVLGRAVTWGAARRRTTSAARARWSTESAHTVLGFGLAAAASLLPTAQALWLAPVWVPLVLAALTSMLLGSARLGRALERAGLFLVPSETQPDPLIARAEELRALTEGDSSGRFRDVVLDAVLVAAHIERLTGDDQHASADPDLRERALRVGPAGLTEDERRTLLGDPSSLRWLHREAWRAWPTETWELSRHAPQLPNVS